MPLAPGTRLGPYEITALIGTGGMGEVYRARDTRLGRDVAIKVSAAQFHPRFRTEARAIAALNHPNICALYDVGPDFLVMEYIDGKPIAGPLPVDEALRYAVQIATALDAAHRLGIVHRDLKPGNILVTRSTVKLVDFGLAKVDTPLVRDETQEMTVTTEGSAVGTLLYMSPEQVQGKKADTRSDIFSFGAVLYELLTGKRAFDGANKASVIAAILTAEPAPLHSLAPAVPAALERVVSRCLAKDPDERWQTSRDLAAELRWIQEGGQAEPASSRRASRAIWAICAAAALAFAAAVWLVSSRPAAPGPRRVLVASQEGLTLPSISPDGRKVAYVGGGKLYIRNLAHVDAIEISDSAGSYPDSGREDVSGPFWSPDSRWLAYTTRSEIRRVAAEGGNSGTVCKTAGAVMGAAWTDKWDPRGTIVFAVNANGIFSVPADGGEPVLIVNRGAEKMYDFHAIILVEGEDFLAWGHPGPFEDGVWFRMSRGGKHPRPAGRSRKGQGAWSAAGFFLSYYEGGGLWLGRWDASRGVPTDGMVLIDKLGDTPSVSLDGSLVYLRRPQRMDQLVSVDRHGHVLREIGQPAPAVFSLSVSPDGGRLALDSGSGLWVYDLASGNATRVVNNVPRCRSPRWSADGKRLGFAGNSTTGSGNAALYVQPADSSSAPEKWMPFVTPTWDWSRSGDQIVYALQRQGNARDIFLAVRGGSAPVELVATPFSDDLPEIDPSGRYMVYQSDESGRFEIYVRTFPAGSGRWLVSTHGGEFPHWSPRGDELFFLESDTLMSAKVSLKETFRVEGQPERLFSNDAARRLNLRVLAPMPDGKRFVMPMRAGNQTNSVVLVENWQADPAGKSSH